MFAQRIAVRQRNVSKSLIAPAVEFAEGYGTGLRTVEGALYGLDLLPIAIASGCADFLVARAHSDSLWIVVWPPTWLETPQAGILLTDRNASADGSAKSLGVAA